MQRKATFSGSWYPSNPQTLKTLINDCMESINSKIDKASSKVIIVPHAGYRYSLRTASYSYKSLSGHEWKRFVLIGPLHRAFLPESIYTTPFDSLETPFGNIKVDPIQIQRLNPEDDENEHSLEMQFPIIKLLYSKATVSLLYVNTSIAPIPSEVVNILADPHTAIVVSSDFCHWGRNFSFTADLSIPGEVSLSNGIRKLNMEALEYIFKNDCANFTKYLKASKNTICGRNPILFAMKLLEKHDLKGKWNLLNYSSSDYIDTFDPKKSSVSYVSACFIEDRPASLHP